MRAFLLPSLVGVLLGSAVQIPSHARDRQAGQATMLTSSIDIYGNPGNTYLPAVYRNRRIVLIEGQLHRFVLRLWHTDESEREVTFRSNTVSEVVTWRLIRDGQL